MVNEDSDTSTSAHAQKEGGGSSESRKTLSRRMVKKYEQVLEEVVYNEIAKGLEYLRETGQPSGNVAGGGILHTSTGGYQRRMHSQNTALHVPNLPPARDRDQEVPRTTPRSPRKPTTRARDEAPAELSQYMSDKLEGPSSCASTVTR